MEFRYFREGDSQRIHRVQAGQANIPYMTRKAEGFPVLEGDIREGETEAEARYRLQNVTLADLQPGEAFEQARTRMESTGVPFFYQEATFADWQAYMPAEWVQEGGAIIDPDWGELDPVTGNAI